MASLLRSDAVPSDYQRSEHEKYFVLTRALRQGSTSTDMQTTFMNGLLGLKALISNEKFLKRIDEALAA